MGSWWDRKCICVCDKVFAFLISLSEITTISNYGPIQKTCELHWIKIMKIPSGKALVVPHESKPVWIVQISVILSYVGIQSPSRKTASCEKKYIWENFETKSGILILNSDFMWEFITPERYGDCPIFNFEKTRCFRLKKNVTVITGIRYMMWSKFSGSKNIMKIFPVSWWRIYFR